MTTKDLSDVRADWELGSNVVAHYAHSGFNLSVISGKGGWTLIRYFTLGEDWVASVDVSDQGPVDVMTRIAELFGAQSV